MIEPKESEQHGMWTWGTNGHKAPITAMRDSEGFVVEGWEMCSVSVCLARRRSCVFL